MGWKTKKESDMKADVDGELNSVKNNKKDKWGFN